ncbi:hypothetical protein [Actinoplanes siamensis]|uniref:40-residue YVTN family beta-propeller repeat-containing protein n=1 Tax=Actinoplanes siamensis TaxID=1223317 RepID=A0A919TMM3_9ACTN|nr:hypothetical protein [Actinoplanes siamensis]GIF07403.1 hypothetical protein Asi03nite_49410 [Actinoplanes siamensis]
MSGRRLAVVVTVEHHDDTVLRRYAVPSADVRSLAAALGDPGLGGFDVEFLQDPETWDVYQRLQALCDGRTGADTLLVYFRGILLTGPGGGLYLATPDTVMQRPADTAVDVTRLDALIHRSQAGQVMIILDGRTGGPVDAGAYFPAARAAEARSRVVITAAARPEPPTFAGLLADGIRGGAADRDRDGYTGIDEVLDHLRQRDPTVRHWVFGSGRQPYISRVRKPGSDQMAAIAELAAAAAGADLQQAAQARATLGRMATGNDRVAAAASAALRRTSLRLAEPAVDFGRVSPGTRQLTVRVQLIGPPLIASSQVTTSGDGVHAKLDGDHLRISWFPTVGRLAGTVTVEGPAGAARLPVTGEVSDDYVDAAPSPAAPPPLPSSPQPPPSQPSWPQPSPPPPASAQPSSPQLTPPRVLPAPPPRWYSGNDAQPPVPAPPAASPDQPGPGSPTGSPHDVRQDSPAAGRHVWPGAPTGPQPHWPGVQPGQPTSGAPTGSWPAPPQLSTPVDPWPDAPASGVPASVPPVPWPGTFETGGSGPSAAVPGIIRPGATTPAATAPGAGGPGAASPGATAPGADGPDSAGPGASPWQPAQAAAAPAQRGQPPQVAPAPPAPGEEPTVQTPHGPWSGAPQRPGATPGSPPAEDPSPPSGAWWLPSPEAGRPAPPAVAPDQQADQPATEPGQRIPEPAIPVEQQTAAPATSVGQRTADPATPAEQRTPGDPDMGEHSAAAAEGEADPRTAKDVEVRDEPPAGTGVQTASIWPGSPAEPSTRAESLGPWPTSPIPAAAPTPGPVASTDEASGAGHPQPASSADSSTNQEGTAAPGGFVGGWLATQVSASRQRSANQQDQGSRHDHESEQDGGEQRDPGDQHDRGDPHDRGAQPGPGGRSALPWEAGSAAAATGGWPTPPTGSDAAATAGTSDTAELAGATGQAGWTMPDNRTAGTGGAGLAGTPGAGGWPGAATGQDGWPGAVAEPSGWPGPAPDAGDRPSSGGPVIAPGGPGGGGNAASGGVANPAWPTSPAGWPASPSWGQPPGGNSPTAYATNPPGNRRRLRVAGILLLALILAAAGYLGIRYTSGKGKSDAGTAPAVTQSRAQPGNPGTAASAIPTEPTAAIPASLAVPVVVDTIEGVGREPEGVAVSPDSRTVYVADQGARQVFFIDAGSGKATPLAVPNTPRFLALSRDGARLYVSMFEDDFSANAMAVIDTASRSVITSVKTGPRPFEPAVAPDGRVWLPIHNGARVEIYDGATLARRSQISVPPNPHWIDFTPDGTRAFTSDHESNKMSVIDTRTLKVLANLSVGRSPHSVAVTPDGRTVVVTNYDVNTVESYDTRTLKLTRRYQVGKLPQAVIVSPDGVHAYVVNEGSDTLSVLDLQTRKVTATIEVGDSPRVVALSRDGLRLFVTAGRDGAVTVLRAAEG